jgi:hypothetical protein
MEAASIRPLQDYQEIKRSKIFGLFASFSLALHLLASLTHLSKSLFAGPIQRRVRCVALRSLATS